MTRCPNCYNSITPDMQSCPSCAYLLIQPERTPTSPLSASAPAQSRTSGRLEAAAQARVSGRLQAPTLARNSGRLLIPEREPSPAEQTPRSVGGEARAHGKHQRPKTTGRQPRSSARDIPDRESRRRKKILIPLMVIALGVASFLLAPVIQVVAPRVDAQTSI